MRTATWAVFCASLAGAGEAEERLSFSDGKWELRDATVATVAGREALRMETGEAHRRDVRLLDGTIEFDVMVSRRRSFVNVAFRMADDDEYEEMYLRPHKSGLPDAVQYAPVYQGQTAWQLYHGPGATAAPEFEPGIWTHVRIVLQGRRAALFLGEGTKPVLVVPRLAREPQAGFLALASSVPPNTPGSGPAACFSNVVVRPGVFDFDFGPAAAEPSFAPGVVRAWSVSHAFPPVSPPPPSLPAPAQTGGFQRVEALWSGLVELHRSIRLLPGSRAAAAVARVHVRADKAGIRRLDLGFSDRATVFLNGQPLFQGEGAYSFDAPRREGLIGYDQAGIYLPLNAGDNELAVVVSDSFGGWGLMGRFADPTGLEVEAR